MKDNNILEVKVNNYIKCEWCDNHKGLELIIPWKIWSEWGYISSQIDGKEWGGVFTVENEVVIKYDIPQQEVSTASCEFKEDLSGNGIVHSHHTMGSFHSTQDDKQARNLYEYSIVLSSTGYEACKKIRTPCGGWSYAKVEIKLLDVPAINLDKIVEEVTAVQTYTPEWWKNRKEEELSKEAVGFGRDDDNKKDMLDLHCNKCIDFDCNNCDHYEDMLDAELAV